MKYYCNFVRGLILAVSLFNILIILSFYLLEHWGIILSFYLCEGRVETLENHQMIHTIQVGP